MLESRKQQIIDKLDCLIIKANTKFGIVIPKLEIRFDLTGRAAGQAYRKNGTYGIRFNHLMMQNEAWEHIINNTVPHELAHVICYLAPNLGNNHDAGWKRVCVSLGGTGKTRHNLDTTLGTKSTLYMYTTTTGHKIALSKVRHNKIQSGISTYSVTNKGKVNNKCNYEIINPM